MSFDFYVDSVNGNNANSGTSPAAAKQTIAAAMTLLTAGKSLGFARASMWREMFSFQHDNITLGVYGTGAMPITDGADVITTLWTQHDAVNFPNVWNVSWARDQVSPAGISNLNLWVNGEFDRFATSIADCQANGGFFIPSLVATTTLIYIKSTVDPNTSGVLYEATRRNHALRGHTGDLGTTRTGQQITGPFELRRCVSHYNAHSGGPGEARQMLLADGNIHHQVTEGSLTEDCLASRVVPTTANAGIFTAFRTVGTGFNHTYRRCLALQPGVSSRAANGGFYGHGSSPTTIDSFTVSGCLGRGVNLAGADTANLLIENCYAEDIPQGPAYNIVFANTDTTIRRCMAIDRTVIANAQGNRLIRRTGTPQTITVENVAGYLSLNGSIESSVGGPAMTVQRCAIQGFPTGSTTGLGGNTIFNAFYNIINVNGAALAVSTAHNNSDYNIFGWIGNAAARFSRNAVPVDTLATWQAATGADLNSVYIKHADQGAGNPLAIWLGIATNTSAGPAAGDFRVNPNARVYNAANVALIGTFADGVTPITLAGPQEHWDFNTRSVVSGPPSQLPILPVNKLEERQYIEDPEAWNFYSADANATIVVDEVNVSARRLIFVGEPKVISATEAGTSGDVDILLSLDNGSTFPITIASGVTLPYSWTPSAAQVTSQAVLRVRDSADTDITDDTVSFVIATTAQSGVGNSHEKQFLRQIATSILAVTQ